MGKSKGLELKGILPAVVTPFDEKEKLDGVTLADTVRFLIRNGVHGLMVNGSTGEAESLSREERKQVVKIAVEESRKKVPVVAGTGVPSTLATSELTKDAKDAGADAVMIVTPFYLIPNTEGLIKHYRTVAQDVDIPIVLYNIPQHTHVTLTPDVIARLCEEVPSICALKDSSGSVGQFAETIRVLGDRISIMQGSDDLLMPSFVLGARGAIVALANIAPRKIVDMYELVQKGEIPKAREIYMRLLPIARAIGSEYNFPAPVKEALKLLGRPGGPTRSPIVPTSRHERDIIRDALNYAGLL